MAPARPIHDIFAALAEPGLAGPGAAEPGTADPAAALREGGHNDLADVLVAEAIVSYAGTAPAEVAEHLAPFVAAHSPVPAADPDAAVPDLADGLALLVTAPVVAEPELAPPGEPDPPDFGAGELQEGSAELLERSDPMDLDFGEGAGLSEPQAAVESVEFDLSPTQPEPDPGEPEPTEPDPTQPGPTEPGPIEPDPTEDTLGEA